MSRKTVPEHSCLMCSILTVNPNFCSRDCANNFQKVNGHKKADGTYKALTKGQYAGPGKNRAKRRSSDETRQRNEEFKHPVAGCCFDCEAPQSTGGLRCKKCQTKAVQYLSQHPRVTDWMNGDWSLGGTVNGLSKTIRDYLMADRNYVCEACGFTGFHPIDSATILEVNHIDGDGQNHHPDNLEILCPNCHALTDSFRNRNLGNGRPIEYIRKERM